MDLRRKLRTAPALGAALFVACSATRPVVPLGDDPDAACVYSIGESSILNYRKDRDAFITIIGRNLDSPRAEISVSATGVVPLKGDELEVVEEKFGQMRVRVAKSYFDDAKDGQLLTLTVNIAAFDAVGAAEARALKAVRRALDAREESVAAADAARAEAERAVTAAAHLSGRGAATVKEDLESSRRRLEAGEEARRSERARRPSKVIRKTFELQSDVEFLANVAPRRVSLADIQAFPMASGAVQDVFGNLVDDHYYVVALRVFNRTETDYVITTGLIGARGQVLVYQDGADTLPAFMVPTTVQPERMSLVYSFVNDRRADKPREWIFRSLQFVGALATGIFNAFPAGEDTIRGLGIFTGILIPEGEKLWPDHAPNHLKALVTFGMPDVAKVPAGGSAGGVLFYAKKQLHSTVHDVAYFSRSGDALVQPSQFVAALQLDGLDVRFERVQNEADRRILQEITDERSGKAAGAAGDALSRRIADAIAAFEASRRKIEEAAAAADARAAKLKASGDALKASEVAGADVPAGTEAAEKARATIAEAAAAIRSVVGALAETAPIKARAEAARRALQDLVTDVLNEKDAERRKKLGADAEAKLVLLRAATVEMDAQRDVERSASDVATTLNKEQAKIDAAWSSATTALSKAMSSISSDDRKKVATPGTIWEAPGDKR